MLVEIKQKEVEVELKLDEDTARLKLPQAGHEVKDATARVKEYSESERTYYHHTALKHTIYNTIIISSSSSILDILI